MRFDLHPFGAVDDARAWAVAEIDAAAASARGRFITTTAGQDATYRAKYEEAARYIAAGYPADMSAYPWVAAESGRSGMAPRAAADRIKQRGDVWNRVVGPAIEGCRIAGKSSVAAVTTVAAVARAVRLVVDQLAQITEEGAPAPD